LAEENFSIGEVSGAVVIPVLVEVEAGAEIGACAAIVDEVVTVAVCESLDERNVGVWRRHPPATAMTPIRGRSLLRLSRNLRLPKTKFIPERLHFLCYQPSLS